MHNLVTIILNFLKSIQTLAYPLLIIDIIISAVALMIPSQKYRSVAVGFLVVGVIGFVLMIGATTFGTEIQDTVTF